MGRPDGFMKYARRETRLRPAAVRIQDFEELHVPLSHEQRRQQAARCMNCGVPLWCARRAHTLMGESP